MEKAASRAKSLKTDLFKKYTERAALRKRLAKLHEDNNYNGKPFDLYELKGIQSDIAIISDEISAIELEIETLE